VVTSAHPSPRPKRQIDRLSHFCTAHGKKVSILYNGRPFPQNCPSRGGSGPHLIHDSLGQSEPIIQTASRSFSCFRTCECSYTLQRAPLSPKLPLPMGDLDPHLTRDSLGPSKPTIQTAYGSVQPFLHSMAIECPYTLQRDALPLKIKIAPSLGDLDTWFPGPTTVLNPNGISIGSVAF